MTRRETSSELAAESDAQLIERFNGGDESAFLEIVARYRPEIFATALGMLRSEEDAKEVTEDTFLRARRGLNRFRGESAFASWLSRIALNLARNRYWYLYRRRRHAVLLLDSPLDEFDTPTFAELVARDAGSYRERSRKNPQPEMEKLEPPVKSKYFSSGGYASPPVCLLKHIAQKISPGTGRR